MTWVESHSQHPSNGGAMEDRLSSLPDDLLHSILRNLPLKHAARTSALSRRWVLQWLRALAASPVLDFTDRDFARRQPPAWAAATVGRCLRLHADHGAALDVLRVALVSPSGSGYGEFGRDVIGWVTAAVARGAREVDVDLTPSQEDAVPHADHGSAAFLELPGDLFQARNSMERLALGRLSLRAVPLPAAGLAGLRSLSLSHADVTDEALRGLLASCRALEFLSLRCCSLLIHVSVASERLRVLELLGCRAVRELRVAAPALESFALYGHTFYADPDGWGNLPVDFDLGATPALRDAYLSHLGCDDYFDVEHNGAYPCLLGFVRNARILTLCSTGVLCTDEFRWDGSAMPNLEELQLLMGSLCRDEDLEYVCSFFMVLPLPVLERLFVRLPSAPAHGGSSWAEETTNEDEDEADMILENEIILGQLTFIKVVNFRGTWREGRLLAFLLKRTPILEQLVLVTVEGEGAPGDEQLEVIQERASALEKASREARISVCRRSQDDSPKHAHTRFFHEEYCCMHQELSDIST